MVINAWVLTPLGKIFIHAARRTTQRIHAIISVSMNPTRMTHPRQSGSCDYVEQSTVISQRPSNTCDLDATIVFPQSQHARILQSCSTKDPLYPTSPSHPQRGRDTLRASYLWVLLLGRWAQEFLICWAPHSPTWVLSPLSVLPARLRHLLAVGC